MSKEIRFEQVVDLVFRDQKQVAVEISSSDMCLLEVCTSCDGKCCVGRTMADHSEREEIVAYTGKDHFIHWAGDLYYLDGGVCPYLKNGRCSVQEIKPFVCRIYPFVPRVVDGEFWLYCVGECDAGPKLTSSFKGKARALAQQFFVDRKPEDYLEFWNQNKIGDFDDTRIVCRIKVYD